MAQNKKLTQSPTSPMLLSNNKRGFEMLLCDFNNIVGAKVITETRNRVKVKYFTPKEGEIVRWLDRNEISKIYRYKY